MQNSDMRLSQLEDKVRHFRQFCLDHDQIIMFVKCKFIDNEEYDDQYITDFPIENETLPSLALSSLGSVTTLKESRQQTNTTVSFHEKRDEKYVFFFVSLRI